MPGRNQAAGTTEYLMFSSVVTACQRNGDQPPSPMGGETLKWETAVARMTEDLKLSAESGFLLRVLSYYAQLVPAQSTGEPDLGGNLLYAGELDQEGRALVVASNVAGAASLCATADQLAQKQAIRDGIVDFLVTSLDESLRILKNEIRKRAPVAVCIAAAPAPIEVEMAERGVVADLLRPPVESTATQPDGQVVVTWSVSSAPAQWLLKLDALALECLDPDAGSARRWLRNAPRYLGRLAQSTRLLHADHRFAGLFLERAKLIEQAPIHIQVTSEDGSDEFTSAHWNRHEAHL